MEFIILIAAIAVIGFFIFKNTTPKALDVLDFNKDGKVDTKDVKAAADVNKDGKVDLDDAKAAVKKTKTAVRNNTQRKTKNNGNRT
jgi:Ca2+-binding EF-hand superfamily protein